MIPAQGLIKLRRQLDDRATAMIRDHNGQPTERNARRWLSWFRSSRHRRPAAVEHLDYIHWPEDGVFARYVLVTPGQEFDAWPFVTAVVGSTTDELEQSTRALREDIRTMVDGYVTPLRGKQSRWRQERNRLDEEELSWLERENARIHSDRPQAQSSRHPERER